MSEDPIKRGDQIALLQACAEREDNGTPFALFSYPNCGWDLVQSGLVNQDTTVTTAGRAALYLLGLGEDPTAGKSFTEIKIPLPEKPE